MRYTAPSSRRIRSAFTLIELLVVIAIIAILATIAVPAIRTISKGNDQAQAVNLIRSMISTARSIAISQHRQAGVVFFEETPAYSNPINSNQTAMQLFVEDYNQQQYGLPSQSQLTVFIYYSTARQYLPNGVKLATLGDSGLVVFAENTTSLNTRAVVFDSNGQLLTRSGLYCPNLGAGVPGTYPLAFGDWKFPTPSNQFIATSSPGFFLYNKNEFDAQAPSLTSDILRTTWLLKNADVVIINPNTGTVIK